MNSRFSIIVPVYNTEKYIKECVDSILNQTYQNYELILVDDGSTDTSSKICDEYKSKDSRIKVIHKTNGGLVSARKAGAEEATGEYIACIDSDDWIDNEYLSEFEKIIEKYKPDIICGGLTYVYNTYTKKLDSGIQYGIYDKEKIKKEIYPILIEGENGVGFNNCLCGKVIKRNIYLPSQMAVDDKIKIAEDHACLKPCIINSDKIYLLNSHKYYYRQNNESMTKEKKALDLYNAKRISKHLMNNIKIEGYNFEDQINRLAVHGLFPACCSQFYENTSYKNVKEKIELALEDNFYKDAIENCKFKKFTKFWFAKYVLKYKMYYIMKLYSKFK